MKRVMVVVTSESEEGLTKAAEVLSRAGAGLALDNLDVMIVIGEEAE